MIMDIENIVNYIDLHKQICILFKEILFFKVEHFRTEATVYHVEKMYMNIALISKFTVKGV